MYYKELAKYLKKDVGNPQSMAIYEHAICDSYEPMAKVMKEYFEFGLGDLINDFYNHKRKIIHDSYYDELLKIYIRMLNVLIGWNQTERWSK